MNISINHLDKTYRGGVHALDNVTLTISTGSRWLQILHQYL